MKKFVIALGVAAAGYGLYNIARTGESLYKLGYEIRGLKWKGVTQGVLGLDVRVALLNPSAKTLNLTGIFLNVRLPEGERIARITQTKGLPSVPAKGESVLDFPVRVGLLDNLFNLSDIVRNYLSSNKPPRFLTIEGYVDVNGVQYPVTHKYNLDEKDA